MKLLQTEGPINKNFAVAIGFKDRHNIILEDGTLVLKYSVDALSMTFIFKAVSVFGKRDGVRCYKKSGN